LVAEVVAAQLGQRGAAGLETAIVREAMTVDVGEGWCNQRSVMLCSLKRGPSLRIDIEVSHM
jgi:hypothetical protein